MLIMEATPDLVKIKQEIEEDAFDKLSKEAASDKGQNAKDVDSEECEHDWQTIETDEMQELPDGDEPGKSGNVGPSGNSYLKNTILDEVLSEKKMELLHSPEVIRFLRDMQNARKKDSQHK